MILGTDHEGRDITYDGANGRFAIGGIATRPDRILAYDRGGQGNWASEEMRAWVAETDTHLRQTAAAAEAARPIFTAQESARQVEEQRRAARYPAYDAQRVVRLAETLKGLATTIIVAFTIAGILVGLAMGLTTGAAGSLAGSAAGAGALVVGVIVFPLLFGGLSFLVGYLVTLGVKVAAEMLLTTVQIELNTRGTISPEVVA